MEFSLKPAIPPTQAGAIDELPDTDAVSAKVDFLILAPVRFSPTIPPTAQTASISPLERPSMRPSKEQLRITVPKAE